MTTLLKQFCYTLSAVSILSSCHQSGNQDSNPVKTDRLDNPTSDSLTETIEQTSFPKDLAILLPTQYRKESTGYPKGIAAKEWYEIYKDPETGVWKTGRADLNISYGRDECVGEDVMIVQSEHQDARLFFSPIESLSASPETIMEDKTLFPEHPLKFEFNEKEYWLSPRGSCLDEQGVIMTTTEVGSKTDEDLVDNTKISGYQLYFETEGLPALEITVMENIEYATPRLLWAGDLNQDGLPDLILDLPDFYESRHVFFFLSDKNDPEKPLKKVADLQVVNDC